MRAPRGSGGSFDHRPGDAHCLRSPELEGLGNRYVYITEWQNGFPNGLLGITWLRDGYVPSKIIGTVSPGRVEHGHVIPVLTVS